MDHAKQVIYPQRQSPWPAVTKRDTGILFQAICNRRHLFIRYIPYDHGIVLITKFVMPDDNTKALDQTHVLQGRDPCDCLYFRYADLRRNNFVWLSVQWQTLL